MPTSHALNRLLLTMGAANVTGCWPDGCDAQATIKERLRVSVLVGKPPPEDQLECVIRAIWLHLFVNPQHVECRDMAAPKMFRQISWTENPLTPHALHMATLHYPHPACWTGSHFLGADRLTTVYESVDSTGHVPVLFR